jgi:hypothetical protein
MDLPEGYHREVIEARESSEAIDFTDSRVEIVADTKPLNSGGASFKTHKLVKISSSKLAYRPTFFNVLFCSTFFIIGLSVIAFYVFAYFQLLSIPYPKSWFMLIFGSIFSLVGGYFCYTSFMPRVFDKQLGIYYKTYTFNFHSTRIDSKSQITLKSIIAIQIIGEHIKSKDGSYKSFELNLVLDDKSRRNVVDHGNIKSIVDDAHVLRDFLNVPIWHEKTHRT